MYKNVGSKVFNQTKLKNDIPRPKNSNKRNNQLKTNFQKTQKLVRPNSASAKSLGVKPSLSSQQRTLDVDDEYNYYQPKVSMFDEYYKDKLIKKNIIPNTNNLNDNNEIKNEITEQQMIKNDNYNLNNNYDLEKNENKLVQRPLTENHNYTKPKDFLADSKYIISCIQNANNSNKLKKNYLKENPYHKEFGKTPKYLQNMKLEAEKKKEIEQLKKETSKYPKGTRLLSEEERLFTLEKLIKSKNDINQIIEKLPITCDSQAFRAKKEELFKKLDEIENAIEIFSKKKVFVKIENK
jgi:hypothetical protein